jgi:osmoprotectant transport system ATP-binding protein
MLVVMVLGSARLVSDLVRQLDGVYKSYGDKHTAVVDVNLKVAAGEQCVLVGPSGSSKTTTMRIINRLQEPGRGTFRVNGKSTSDLDVNELRIQTYESGMEN